MMQSLMPRYDDFYNTNVDVWSTRGEFLRRGGGDCEEYAISKRDSLKDLGVDNQKMPSSCSGKKYKKISYGASCLGKFRQRVFDTGQSKFRVLLLSKRYDLRQSIA